MDVEGLFLVEGEGLLGWGDDDMRCDCEEDEDIREALFPL